MKKKTLSELAKEYGENRCCIEEKIASCRAELIEARQNGKNFEIAKLLRKLTVLYDQRDELAQIESHLSTYYSKEMRCAG